MNFERLDIIDNAYITLYLSDSRFFKNLSAFNLDSDLRSSLNFSDKIG